MKRRWLSFSRAVASWTRCSPLPASSPMESSATLGSLTPSTRSLKSEPMWAYWARLMPVESVVAPMSSRMRGPLSVIICTARAGRSTPGRRFRWRIAEATPAPVWPAVTTASASPSRTRRMATLMLASRLRRTATAGGSSMPTVSEACTMRTCDGSGSSMKGRMRASSPTRMTSTSLCRRAQSTAPRTTSSGAWSPPMASTATRGRSRWPTSVPRLRASTSTC